MVYGRKGLVVCGGQGEGGGARGGGGGRDQVRLGQVGAGVTVWMMGVVVGVRVRVGNTGLPCGLSHCGLCIAPGDEVSVLELGTTRLLRRQLELDKHHVITNTECQGERGAAGQEVTDLQTKNRTFLTLHSYAENWHSIKYRHFFGAVLYEGYVRQPFHKEKNSFLYIHFLLCK